MSSAGLPEDYRYVVFNDSSVDLHPGGALVIAKGAKFDSNGALSYLTEAGFTLNASLADGSYAVLGSAVDNGTDLALGVDGWFGASTANGSPAGTVELYLQRSPDDGTTWPDDGKGTLLSTLTFDATEGLSDDFAV